MTPRDDVIISYSSLAPESTLSGQRCPFCKGGRSGECTFGVGRTGPWLWWRCHRASCGAFGKHRLNGTGEVDETRDEKRKRFRNFKRTDLSRSKKRWLAERFHVDPETIEQARWSYTPDYDGHGPRVIMPIFSPYGAVRGEHFRSYSGHLPKSLINGELSENMICWYKFRKYCRTLIICEDQPSALRAAEAGIHSLALLGTVLTLDRVLEIKEQGYTTVYLCLDDDATTQSVKYIKEFRPYLPQLRIKALSDGDIKDLSKERFSLFIQECLT